MTQIILIENRRDIHNLLESNLLNSFKNVEVISKKDSSETLTLLDILPNIPLIICRDFIENDDTAKNIIHFVQQNKYLARIIVLGNVPNIPIHNRIVAIPDPPQYRDVIHHASKILKIPIVQNNQTGYSEYSPISINYFIDIETCCCDAFLRIRKKNEPDQYIKVIREREGFSKEQIIKYALQETAFLYVHSHKRQNFINFISDKWVKKINQLNHDNLTFEKKIEYLAIAHEIIAREINEQGFNSAAAQLTDSLVISILEDLNNNKLSIPDIIHQITHTKSHYMYKHSHMVFILSIQVLNTMGMNDQNSYKTLCFASLFKDISLIYNPLLSKITHFEELESSNISQYDYNNIINHACESAFLLKEYKEIPPKSLELIVRHHGHITGNGFSNIHFGKFDALERIFFINCEFVKEFLTFNKNLTKSHQKTVPITYRLRRRYFFPEISDAIDILNKTLQQQKQMFSKPDL